MAEQEKKRTSGKKLTSRKKGDRDIRRLIGDRIRTYRSAQAMTQEKLAKDVGRNLSANSLSRYETGETEMGVVTFLALASTLGVEPNDLVPDELLKSTKSRSVSQEFEKLSDDRKYIVNQIINSLLCQQERQK